MHLRIKRIVAYNIDFIVAFIIFYIPILLFKNFLENFFWLSLIVFFSLGFLFLLLMIYKDILFKNQSLGKKIVNIRILQNGQIPDRKTIIRRNKFTVLGIMSYPFTVIILNKSIGDIICGTEVK